MDGEGEVTPIGSVKRKKSTIHEPDYTSCLICQEGGRRGEKLSQATDDGKMKVQNAAAERTRLKDRTSLSILNRLKNMSEEDWSSELKWHKTCYINFASESRLSRLRDSRSKEQVVQAPTSVVDQPSTSSSFHGTRKQGHAVNTFVALRHELVAPPSRSLPLSPTSVCHAPRKRKEVSDMSLA